MNQQPSFTALLIAAIVLSTVSFTAGTAVGMRLQPQEAQTQPIVKQENPPQRGPESSSN